MFKVMAVWTPGGSNTAKFSYGLSREFSQLINVILVELPCLGIPRLGFAVDIMDRENHTEAAISELEKKGELSFAYIHKQGGTLSVLPSSVFAMPDLPLTQKVELKTLTDFPGHFSKKARQQGYGLAIFECQGQLTNPMTFFAVKNADVVLMPVNEPWEIAFSLINIKRLVQAFKFEPDKFIAVSRENVETLSEVMVVKDDVGGEISRIKVLPESYKEIVSDVFFKDDAYRAIITKKKAEERKNILSHVLGSKIFKSKKTCISMKPAEEIETNCSAGEEAWKIKL